MEILDAFATPLVAALAVLAVHFLSRGRFREIMRRLDSLEAGQREFRAELAGMRSDLTHVALAVGAREKPNAG